MGNFGSTVQEDEEPKVHVCSPEWLAMKAEAHKLFKQYHRAVQGLVGIVSTDNLSLFDESKSMFSEQAAKLPDLFLYVEKNKHKLHMAVDGFADDLLANDGKIVVDMATLTPMYALFINMVLAILNRKLHHQQQKPENMHIVVWDAGLADDHTDKWSWIITAAASFNTRQRVHIHYAKQTNTGIGNLASVLLDLGSSITNAHIKNGKPAAVTFYEMIMDVHPQDKVATQQMKLELHVQEGRGDNMIDVDFHTVPYGINHEFAKKTGFKHIEREPDAQEKDIAEITAHVTEFLKIGHSAGKAHYPSYSSSSSSSSSHHHIPGTKRTVHGNTHPHPPVVHTKVGKMACNTKMGKISGRAGDDVRLRRMAQNINILSRVLLSYSVEQINQQVVPLSVISEVDAVLDSIIDELKDILRYDLKDFPKKFLDDYYGLIQKIPRQIFERTDMFYNEPLDKYDHLINQFEMEYSELK